VFHSLGFPEVKLFDSKKEWGWGRRGKWFPWGEFSPKYM
jgi:hypothetical protein